MAANGTKLPLGLRKMRQVICILGGSNMTELNGGYGSIAAAEKMILSVCFLFCGSVSGLPTHQQFGSTNSHYLLFHAFLHIPITAPTFGDNESIAG